MVMCVCAPCKSEFHANCGILKQLLDNACCYKIKGETVLKDM